MYQHTKVALHPKTRLVQRGALRSPPPCSFPEHLEGEPELSLQGRGVFPSSKSLGSQISIQIHQYLWNPLDPWHCPPDANSRNLTNMEMQFVEAKLQLGTERRLPTGLDDACTWPIQLKGWLMILESRDFYTGFTYFRHGSTWFDTIRQCTLLPVWMTMSAPTGWHPMGPTEALADGQMGDWSWKMLPVTRSHKDSSDIRLSDAV